MFLATFVIIGYDFVTDSDYCNECNLIFGLRSVQSLARSDSHCDSGRIFFSITSLFQQSDNAVLNISYSSISSFERFALEKLRRVCANFTTVIFTFN